MSDSIGILLWLYDTSSYIYEMCHCYRNRVKDRHVTEKIQKYRNEFWQSINNMINGIFKNKSGLDAPVCNPRYLGGRDWEDYSSRPAKAKS
jgi:hypothetical protein